MSNKLLVFTGDGKGKTTAALGAALRAAGHKKSVLILQFLKGRIKSGEQNFIKKHSEELNIRIEPLGGGFVYPSDEKSLEEAKVAMKNTIQKVTKMLNETRPDMLILDEFCVVLSLGLIEREKAEELLDKALSFGHTIVTGRNAPVWLIDRADTVTEMVEVKHPFRKGTQARKGIEF